MTYNEVNAKELLEAIKGLDRFDPAPDCQMERQPDGSYVDFEELVSLLKELTK